MARADIRSLTTSTAFVAAHPVMNVESIGRIIANWIIASRIAKIDEVQQNSAGRSSMDAFT